MSQLEVADNNVAVDTERASSAYVPSLQRTEGQPPPIAAHGGLSYMSFDRAGDAGTAVALQDALVEIAEGEAQRVVEMIDKAPPGPIETKWGLGFRDYDECVKYIRQSNSIKAPEGGLALPLPYTVYERPSYSVVPSNAIWRDPARANVVAILRKYEQGNRQRNLYFPQVMRDARRIGEYYPGLSPNSPECMDRLGVSLAHLESKCTNIYDAAEVERVLYPEIEKLLLEFFPDATDALVYNHDVFDKDYTGDRTEDQDSNNPGVNANYANLVHNDLNDNSGRVRCRELLTRNLRNFRAHAALPRKRPTPRCRGGSCRSTSPSRSRRSSSSPSCSAPGPPSPTSRTSPTIGSTTTASARPPASPTVPTTSGTGFPGRSRPRSRCSNATTL
jgi:hypothetical protein